MRYMLVTTFGLFVGGVLGYGAQVAFGAAVMPRKDNPTAADCTQATSQQGAYHGGVSQACLNLISDCLTKIETETAVWHKTSCLAAATCDGTENMYTLARCKNPAIPPMTQTIETSTNIWTNIVGSCGTNCAMTQQNYIDWFYGSLSAINSTDWPVNSAFVINNYWRPMTQWAATGNTLPFRSFDDWIHFSDSSASDGFPL